MEAKALEAKALEAAWKPTATTSQVEKVLYYVWKFNYAHLIRKATCQKATELTGCCNFCESSITSDPVVRRVNCFFEEAYDEAGAELGKVSDDFGKEKKIAAQRQ